MTVELGRVGPGWEGRGGVAEAEKALSVRGWALHCGTYRCGTGSGLRSPVGK